MGYADLGEVKQFFALEEDDTIDDLLEFLIDHYSQVIEEKTGVFEASVLTKDALFFAIACHLIKTHVDKISPVIAYTIGAVKERYQSPSRNDESWCDLYHDKIDEIKRGNQQLFGAVGIRRRGISR